MQELIDPEEMPFTVDEIYEACLQFMPAGAARRYADDLAASAPDTRRHRRARRLRLRKAGYPEADRQPSGEWDYPPDLMQALEALSDDAVLRVAGLRRYRQEFAVPQSAPTRLTPRLVRAELKRIGATGRLARGLVISGARGLTGDDVADAFEATPTGGGNAAFEANLRAIVERRHRSKEPPT